MFSRETGLRGAHAYLCGQVGSDEDKTGAQERYRHVRPVQQQVAVSPER